MSNLRMKAAREKLGVSKGYVASMLGITVSTVNAFENGTTVPTKAELQMLSEIYLIPEQDLMKPALTEDEKIAAFAADMKKRFA